MIYADNAATTKLDADAFELMKEYLITEFMNRKRGECDEKTVY